MVGGTPAQGFTEGLGLGRAQKGPLDVLPLTQDYSAIIELVETLQALPTYDVTEQHNVCFHYTFALNR